MSSQAVGSGLVLYHCDVTGLKISTTAVYDETGVHPPTTTSTDLRLKTSTVSLAVGIGGIVCFHICDCSSYVYTSLILISLLFLCPPIVTNLP